MTDAAFTATVRDAQSRGVQSLAATLSAPYKGCRNILIDVSGLANNNKHDLWVYSKARSRVLGRSYLGSRKMAADLQGWPERIESLSHVV